MQQDQLNWEYQEYRFHNQLDDVVACVWKESFFGQSSNKHRDFTVFPDHSIELIFTHNTISRTDLMTHTTSQHGSHLAGIKTRPQLVRATGSSYIGIRFKPEAFYRVCGNDVGQTVDCSVAPELIFRHNIGELEQRLFQESTLSGQMAIIENFLQSILAGNDRNADVVFEQLMRHIQLHKGQVGVADLAALSGKSVKTIERKFKKYLGVNPKKYCRMVRAINALKEKPSSKLNLTSKAYAHNYYDQTHFVKEVREFMSLTPSSFFKADKGIQTPTFG